MNAVYAEFFPGDKPARYCIQCGLVKPDALVEAARDAWLLSGVDAAKAKVEAVKFSTRENADLAVMSDECEPFEIRSAPPAGG